MDEQSPPDAAPSVPPRILVVEDDTAVRDFCLRCLRLDNYQMAAAQNGRVALEQLQADSFDLILTDLQMPEMGGIRLLQELRQFDTDTDVIVLTAYGSFETVREAMRLGAVDYLTKPVSVDNLLHTVQRTLEWRRVRQEKQRLSEMVALYEISQTFTSTLDTATAVREIVHLLWRRFVPQSLSLSLFHPDTQELELLVRRNTEQNDLNCTRVSLLHADPPAIIVAHDMLAGAEDVTLSPSHHATLLLRSNDRPVGVLRLTRGVHQPGFGKDDRTLLSICASQIAASLDNSRLYQQLKQQNLQTISALAAAIDARDPYTLGHSEQVMRYAVRLAEVLGLSAERIEHVRYGALLHDIGKIGIRDHILLKPGPLSVEEVETMRRHPRIGATILGGITALREILPIIECHHERMDGNGYPLGISGTHLSEEARILAIADAYDAMTSDRAYRRGMPQEQAFQILMDGRNTHWDGTFVERFIQLIQQEGAQLTHNAARPAQLAVLEPRQQSALVHSDLRD